MMWPGFLKRGAQFLGIYRHARWVNQRLFRRDDLRQQQEDAAFFARLLNPGDLVFDVGANIGNKTRVFLGLGTSVVAFEPQSDCAAELRLRIGEDSRLVLEECALGARNGEAVLHVHAHRGSSSLLGTWGGEKVGEVTVPVWALDTMIHRYGTPNYIKVDVEGYDLEVLKGLSQPIALISFEFHCGREEDVRKTLACLEYLSSFGNLTLNISPAERSVFHYPDWVSLSDFFDYFPHSFKDNYAFRYGDIFVRTSNSHVDREN